MIKITIISVGRIKEKYWQQAINEYAKRLKPYVKLKFTDLPEEKVNNISNQKQITAKECKKIIKVIPKDSTVIVLDMQGYNYHSEEFSRKIAEWSEYGREITFIIGGPLGLSQEVLDISNQKVSLSDMTFTHQMAKVILTEQIYRGIMIQNGKTFHY